MCCNSTSGWECGAAPGGHHRSCGSASLSRPALSLCRIVTAETEGRSAQGGRTAAAVVASRSSPTLPATCAVATQTDLTWPKGQKEPSVLPPPASLSSQKTTQTTTDKLSPRRNNTGDTQVSGKRVSTQSPSPDVSTLSLIHI